MSACRKIEGNAISMTLSLEVSVNHLLKYTVSAAQMHGKLKVTGEFKSAHQV